MKTLQPIALLSAMCLISSPVALAQQKPNPLPLMKAKDMDPLRDGPRKGLGDRLFYIPTRDEPATPAKWGFQFQQMDIISKDGTRLNAWWVDSKQQPSAGTVVFSHGNAGSMGHHLGFVLWLAKAGYDVLMYDYRGYGKSQGKTDRVGMVQDAWAALNFAGNHPNNGKRPVISYGHSLGGAKSVTAIAEAKTPHLRAVVTDATFASYRDMAVVFGGRLAGGIVSDDLSPVDHIAKISPLPLLMIHGKEDGVIPFAQAQKLYGAAEKPKTLFDVEQGRHGDSLVRDEGAYRKKMLLWLADNLKG